MIVDPCPGRVSLRLLLAVTLSLFTAACEKNDGGFFPLYAGPVWQYDIEKQTVIGLIRQREIIQNLGPIKNGGMEHFVRTSISGVQFYYSASDKGIVLDYLAGPDRTQAGQTRESSTVFQYPLSVGSQWQDEIITSTLKSHDPQAVEVIESIPLTVRIESVNDSVRVPAGKFSNCLRIVALGEKRIQAGKYAYQTTMTIALENTRWYARGVGLVKEVQVENTNILQYPKGSFTRVLKKFSPSP